jgi:hypothetical protein
MHLLKYVSVVLAMATLALLARGLGKATRARATSLTAE